jgi:predicted DNA-binding protein (MmcQ/YjbR family)
MIDTIREHCLAKKAVTEYFPFDEDTLCFRVGSKIFALVSLENNPLRINLKCEPERAIELREHHSNILPGYHMNKQHWNTVICDFNLSNNMLIELIDHSYDLVYSSLTKKERTEIEANFDI